MSGYIMWSDSVRKGGTVSAGTSAGRCLNVLSLFTVSPCPASWVLGTHQGFVSPLADCCSGACVLLSGPAGELVLSVKPGVFRALQGCPEPNVASASAGLLPCSICPVPVGTAPCITENSVGETGLDVGASQEKAAR